MDRYYSRQRLDERPPVADLRLKAKDKDALPCASAEQSSNEALLNQKLTLFPLVIPPMPLFQHSMWFFKVQKPWAFSNDLFKNCPVYEVGMLTIASGVPCPITSPPSSPPSGPRSMI